VNRELGLYLHSYGLNDDTSASSRSSRTHTILPILRISQ